jgi:aldehyde:ferredoxin oxidoreductase
MHGWMGQILRINLSKRKISKEALNPDLAKNYIGGSGLAAKILWDEVPPDVEPYGSGNKLIITVGPLVGALSPTSGRTNISHKNPLTGGYGDSNIGGFWGPEFKFAGYDGLIIEGKSKTPVYIWINNDQVEIRDASDLWGLNTWDTEDSVREALNEAEAKVLCIGPAGEHLTLNACIIGDRARAAAWTGSGSVMGSKKLKAIVVKGNNGVRIADPEKFEQACQKALADIDQSPTIEILKREGQPSLTAVFQGPKAGGMPTGTNCCYNWSKAHIPDDKFEACTGDYLHQTQVKKSKACFGCPVHCSHWLEVKKGPYAGTKGEGFEWNSHAEAFKMGIFDQEWMTLNNNICNQLGFDINGPGGSIAWAMECFEKGILTEEDTDGLKLNWGNQKAATQLTYDMAYRRGFGSILADGPLAASRKIGRDSEKWVNFGKGGCEARYDHRWGYGWVLGQALSTRGPDHLKGCSTIELAGYPADYIKSLGLPVEAGNALIPEGKGAVVVFNERIHVLCDTITMCKFPTMVNHTTIREEMFAQLLTTITGVDYTAEKLIKIADRINALQKSYNVMAGIGTRDNDIVARRMHEDPIETALPLIPRENLEKMKDDYYACRSWHIGTGLPTVKSLMALDLGDVAEKIISHGVKLVKE